MDDNNQSNSFHSNSGRQSSGNQNDERASFKAYGTYTPKQAPQSFHHELEPQTPLKHSGLGITSFIFSILSLLLIVVSIIIVVVNVASLDQNDLLKFSDPYYVEQMLLNEEFITSGIIGLIIGVFMLLSVGFFAFLGFIFGLISLFMKNRKKVFGIIGISINGLLCIVGIIFIFISVVSTFVV